MLEKCFTNYLFPNKSCVTQVADQIISVTTSAFNCGKTVQYHPEVKAYIPMDEVGFHVFYRILLIPVVIVLLPITFVACIIKLCDAQNMPTQDASELCNMQDTASHDVSETSNCSICMESLQDTNLRNTALTCMHVFHAQCIEQWLDIKLECPLCKTPQGRAAEDDSSDFNTSPRRELFFMSLVAVAEGRLEWI